MYAIISMFLVAVLSSAPAHAYVFIGNPNLGLKVDRTEGDLTTGWARIDTVRVFKCGGGYTDYPVDALVDPVDGWSKVIDGGDLCSVTVRWDTDVEVESSAFELRYEQLTTSVTFGSTGWGSTAFSPMVVDSGSFSGSTPVFEIWLD